LKSTWSYLFGRNISSTFIPYINFPPPQSHEIGTYSSAQFSVSKESLQNWPLKFWNKMLSAINGSINLSGCDPYMPQKQHYSLDLWSGHQLTGQYERLWHIIFGQNYIQTTRRNDKNLHPVLRIECFLTGECDGAV
jgi:hypothetical protein